MNSHRLMKRVPASGQKDHFRTRTLMVVFFP